jgi:hypothetical protein
VGKILVEEKEMKNKTAKFLLSLLKDEKIKQALANEGKELNTLAILHAVALIEKHNLFPDAIQEN